MVFRVSLHACLSHRRNPYPVWAEPVLEAPGQHIRGKTEEDQGGRKTKLRVQNQGENVNKREEKQPVLPLELGDRGHSNMWIHLERQTEEKNKVQNWKNWHEKQ